MGFTDTREHACELKCLVDARTAAAVRHWARERMQPDAHLTPGSERYLVTSLYFDTPDQAVLNRRGSYSRSKYRVRRYDAADNVFLERKTKTRLLVNKRREQLPLAQLAPVLRAPAQAGANGMAAPGGWFRRRLELRQLEPACLISYQRLACVGTSPAGPLRLTLDDALQCWPSAFPGFELHAAPLLLLPGQQILELKFLHHLPALFKSLVAQFGLQTTSVSKYRLAATALARRPVSPSQGVHAAIS
ncbi:MAG TPA: polyphosphate polymerase domain-containing protein [Steroidobacteraceae bacterium]|nr:polyphosphate polymerase domain-containing protein [Steroidobacteraceae bacterium]